MIGKGTAFDRSRFARVRVIRPAESYQAAFASPEDVIIKEMDREGGSDKNLRDITGILKVSGLEIDEAYIVEWADRLELRRIWNTIKQRLSKKS